jgi:SAM-dependent methyltransferase
MLAPSQANGRFWYPITRHPLARVLKFRNFQDYLQAMPRGGVVLDYGSGDRPYEQILLTRFDRYIAADYNVTNQHHGGRPDVQIVDGRIDLPDGSVSCLLLTEVLEHIYEPRKALAECFRLLQPGGYLVGSVPFARGEHESPYDFYRYTSFALRQLLTDSGFALEKLHYVGDLSAVAAVSVGETLGLVGKALRKVNLGWLAYMYMLVVRLPEFAYYGLSGTRLDPQRLGQLRSYPLGFTFMARKPAAP